MRKVRFKLAQKKGPGWVSAELWSSINGKPYVERGGLILPYSQWFVFLSRLRPTKDKAGEWYFEGDAPDEDGEG